MFVVFGSNDSNTRPDHDSLQEVEETETQQSLINVANMKYPSDWGTVLFS